MICVYLVQHYVNVVFLKIRTYKGDHILEDIKQNLLNHNKMKTRTMSLFSFLAALAALYPPLSLTDCVEFRALKTKPDQTNLTYLPDWLS